MQKGKKTQKDINNKTSRKKTHNLLISEYVKRKSKNEYWLIQQNRV